MGNFVIIKLTERFAEVLPFGQDRAPAETGLKTLQAQLFKQAVVVGDR